MQFTENRPYGEKSQPCSVILFSVEPRVATKYVYHQRQKMTNRHKTTPTECPTISASACDHFTAVCTMDEYQHVHIYLVLIPVELRESHSAEVSSRVAHSKISSNNAQRPAPNIHYSYSFSLQTTYLVKQDLVGVASLHSTSANKNICVAFVPRFATVSNTHRTKATALRANPHRQSSPLPHPSLYPAVRKS